MTKVLQYVNVKLTYPLNCAVLCHKHKLKFSHFKQVKLPTPQTETPVNEPQHTEHKT